MSDFIKKADAEIKSEAKALVGKAVAAFGLRAVYVGIGAVGTLLVLHFL